MTVAPWVPPLLSGVERGGALWNAVVSYSGHPIPLAGGAAMTFALAEVPEPDASTVAVRATGGPELHVLWTAFPFDKLFGVDFTVGDLAAIPPALRGALVEGMTALVWNAIPDRQFGDFTIGKMGPLRVLLDDARRKELAWFAVTVQNLAKEPVEFVLGCERAALLDALAGKLAAPQTVHKNLKARLTAEAFFTFGGVPVTIGELKSLDVGGLVVLPQVAPDDLSLRIQNVEYRFRAGEGGWTCLDIRGRDKSTDRTAAGNGAEAMAVDAPEQAAQAVPLASLHIVIDFDLGRTAVTLADLESWKAGSVVPLDPPARAEGAEVTLRANGQAIGTGDLVRIDDRLGVRISRLFIAS